MKEFLKIIGAPFRKEVSARQRIEGAFVDFLLLSSFLMALDCLRCHLFRTRSI
jgi:hypothetical protein